ncbi:hypothetical protein RF11_07762 [Thelohanellus kitauei]|uniref:Uncharacterized protein n=1 Tax=Thelohanellus kitauei TaxID=669202 RepID=A0A0C2J3Q0_THEKT|nr:hypothetical protein RF11_07762 [Thelohanellus kitauei]
MDIRSGVSSKIDEIRPEFWTKTSDVNKWLFLFDDLSVANGWNEARQAAVLPFFLKDDALEAYSESPLHSESPSPLKSEFLCFKNLSRPCHTNIIHPEGSPRFEAGRYSQESPTAHDGYVKDLTEIIKKEVGDDR